MIPAHRPERSVIFESFVLDEVMLQNPALRGEIEDIAVAGEDTVVSVNLLQ